MMDQTIATTVAIAVEHVQGECSDPTVAKIVLQEVARKLKKIAGTAKGQPIDFQPTVNGREARDKFWGGLEPSINGYSNALHFLLNNIPDSLVEKLADKFAE